MLHYGQGKWYPGESLPRWAFALYWRTDGQPIWNDPELFAKEKPIPEIAPDVPVEHAEALAANVASALGLTADYITPAFEDPLHWIGKEGELPPNVDLSDPKIDDPEARARILRAFEGGLSKPTGFVLPVQPWNSLASGRRWKSERWKTRRGAPVPDPGRLAGGLPPAARRPAVGRSGGAAEDHAAGPVRPAWAAAQLQPDHGRRAAGAGPRGSDPERTEG